MHKQGEAGGLKNSDIALPEESIAKRKGMKVGKGAEELAKCACCQGHQSPIKLVSDD